ncbi:response regulator transcription factor [Burkholderia cepacia]|uniref:response regulator transcription factor n=1 Tax=Burkholderia cepacia TaxID=292 RepID=UPI002ABDBE1D|nr:response regulator transcription factor [Burkholderia cepacia]
MTPSLGLHPGIINVIIADDHPVVVLGTRKMLEHAPDIHIAASVSDIAALDEALATHACDVLICDFTFSDDGARDGMNLMESLRQRYPALRIILMTVHENAILVKRVLSAGVAGFIGKSTAQLEALPMAVRIVQRGGVYLDPAISAMVAAGDNARGTDTHTRCRDGMLTEREFEVVRQLVKGMSVSDIARETNRSIKTVSTQKMRAMDKLGARSDVELGMLFRKLVDTGGR